MADTVASNNIGLLYAEEVSPKLLSATPAFYELEPNSFDDFGAELGMMTRRPFRRNRQNRKGGVSDLDASGGFNHDLVQRGIRRLLQGFVYASANEKPTTHPMNPVVAGDTSPITSVAAAGVYNATGNGMTRFAVGRIVKASGFTNAKNNGVFVVTATAAGAVTLGNALSVVEAAPPATARLEVVGIEFGAGDIVVTVAAGVVILTATAGTFTGLIEPGEWAFIGGDATLNQITTNIGYGRCSYISGNGKIVRFDKTTFTPAADAGAGKQLRFYVGTVLKNAQDPDNIVKRTYTFERLLGRDANGVQSEQLIGATPNELTWNSPLPGADAKVNLDLGFVGLNHSTRTGTQGPLSSQAGATISAAPIENAFNTANHVFRVRLALIDPATLNPTPLVMRVSEWDITIGNNVTPNKAQGELGAFQTTEGHFDTNGSFTGYFTQVAAIQAVRASADATFDVIYAKTNGAVCVDLPLIGLAGAGLTIEQDTPIMIPLSEAAAEGAFGNTIVICFLPYVPTLGTK